jgi:hypothetical protein
MSTRLVTVKEIAAVAGVGTSAVSNWRKRYADFPVPAEESPSGDRFDLSSILLWMDSHGKKSSIPTSRTDRDLWAVADGLRGSLAAEDAVLVVLQVMYVASTQALYQAVQQERAKTPFASLASAEVSQIRKVWGQCVARLKREQSKPELERALELPRSVSENDLATIVQAVADYATRVGDWSTLATGFLRRAQDELSARGTGQSTPTGLSSLMLALLQPINGVVYDPAAGNAMVLALSSQMADVEKVRLFGQEVNEFNWRIGYLHLALQRAAFDFEEGDTLRSDRFRKLRADRIALDPPLGMRFDWQETALDERWSFGTTANADWMWAQQLLFHLSDEGIGVMVVAAGALSRGGRDARIRQDIVSADLLDAVIELPPGIIPGIGVSVALLVFAKNRSNRSGAVLFVDARQLGETRRGKVHELATHDISRIESTINQWRANAFRDEPLFAAGATLADISANSFDLTAKRYVRYVALAEADSEDTGRRVHSATEQASASLLLVQGLREKIKAAVASLREVEVTVWPYERLVDLLAAAPVTGTRQDPNGDDQDRPWIPTRVVSGTSGRIDSDPGLRTRGRTRGRLTKRGDVLLTSRGIGLSSHASCALVELDEEMAFAESLVLLRPDPNRILADFLRHALTSQSGQTALVAATTGSVIANLRPDALAEVQIRVPNLATQAAIVEALNTIEQGYAMLEQAAVDSRGLLEVVRNEIAAGRMGQIG